MRLLCGVPGRSTHIRRLEVGPANVHDSPGKLAGRRVVLRPGSLYLVQLVERSRSGNALREHPHRALIRAGHPGGGIPANDVVVQNRLQLPALRLRQLGQVTAAVQPLLLPGHRDKDDGAGKLQLRENAARLQRDRRSAGIVIRAGSRVVSVEVIRVPRIVVPRNQYLPRRLGRIRPLQDRVDVLQASVLHDPGAGHPGLNKIIPFHLQTAAASRRIALKLRVDPVGRRINPGPRRQVGIHTRKRAAVLERDQFGNGVVNLLRRDLLQSSRNCRVDRGRLDRTTHRTTRRLNLLSSRTARE